LYDGMRGAIDQIPPVETIFLVLFIIFSLPINSLVVK
jgi:hypothetical protein